MSRDETRALIGRLRAVAGRRHVLTSARATLRFRRGFRAPAGEAVAVVRPGSLVELWRTVQACMEAGVVLVVQAANTGLTGGSTPDARIERPAVIVNTMRLDRVHLLYGGRQVVCLPGATLHALEKVLAPLGREPHSVIGSSCFGASVVGGVCNNSGGALIRRGPAYTELAIFGQVSADGALRLVNHLGIELGDEPETVLDRLERGDFGAVTPGVASDAGYGDHVRAIDADTPARFNADPRRLHDAAGSAGRLVVFAVRLDTFAQETEPATFYVGTNDPDELTGLRRTLLAAETALPIAAEYLHRDTFAIADRYGRDTSRAIRLAGTKRLPALFAAKARVDAAGTALGLTNLSDRLLQRLSRLLPSHLPPRLLAWQDRYEHHLILKVGGDASASIRAQLASMFPSGAGDVFECSNAEADAAWLHRFIAAGAANRMLAVEAGRVGSLVALDVALPRNGREWFAPLPAGLDRDVVAVLRYGHFFCHVFHRDYLLAPGVDPALVKARLLEQLDAQGAEYPAEHNVGRQYRAKPALVRFYRALDPTNRLNPGIGGTPVAPSWGTSVRKGDTP